MHEEKTARRLSHNDDYRCADGAWRPPRPEGLARVLAKAGYGARPRTEALIRSGRLTVDGKVERNPGRSVDREREVRLDGEILCEVTRRYLAVHKPAGVDCQYQTGAAVWLGELLPPDAIGLEPAGRLDARARGLLLVSNDLQWNTSVSRSSGLERGYEVRVSGLVTGMALDVIRAGMNLPGQGPFKPVKVDVLAESTHGTLIGVTVRGEHHRQVRAVFKLLRQDVLSVVRTGIGSVGLVGLATGQTRDLTPAEVYRLGMAGAKG